MGETFRERGQDRRVRLWKGKPEHIFFSLVQETYTHKKKRPSRSIIICRRYVVHGRCLARAGYTCLSAGLCYRLELIKHIQNALVYRGTGWVLINTGYSCFQYPERHSTSDQPFSPSPLVRCLCMCSPRNVCNARSYTPAHILHGSVLIKRGIPLCPQTASHARAMRFLPSA